MIELVVMLGIMVLISSIRGLCSCFRKCFKTRHGIFFQVARSKHTKIIEVEEK